MSKKKQQPEQSQHPDEATPEQIQEVLEANDLPKNMPVPLIDNPAPFSEDSQLNLDTSDSQTEVSNSGLDAGIKQELKLVVVTLERMGRQAVLDHKRVPASHAQRAAAALTDFIKACEQANYDPFGGLGTVE